MKLGDSVKDKQDRMAQACREKNWSVWGKEQYQTNEGDKNIFSLLFHAVLNS